MGFLFRQPQIQANSSFWRSRKLFSSIHIIQILKAMKNDWQSINQVSQRFLLFEFACKFTDYLFRKRLHKHFQCFP